MLGLGRTQQGLYLQSITAPHSLITPWGTVHLTGWCSGMGSIPFLAFGQVLLKRLRAKFDKAFSSETKHEKGQTFLILKPGVEFLRDGLLQDYFDPISIDGLNATQKGKEIFVTPAFDGTAEYAITEFDGKSLPEFIRTPRNCTLDEQIKQSWQEHTERYLREQK